MVALTDSVMRSGLPTQEQPSSASELAPVAVMAYRRPRHLRTSLQALLRCAGVDKTEIHVFVDGPRHEADIANVEATRCVARELLRDQAVYHFSTHNKGLAASIIEAVTTLAALRGRVIVLEDDLIVVPQTLAYLNAALDRYADEDQVMQISAYAFDVHAWSARQNALFLPLTTSWGWATWDRAWARFDPNATNWQSLFSDSALQRTFNFGGTYDFASMLARQMEGLRDSWAIRWYWSVFRAQGLVLYPPRTMVSNTGFDGSGSHGRAVLRRFGGVREPDEWVGALPQWPKSLAVDEQDIQLVKQSIRAANGGRVGWLADRVRNWLGR